MESYYFQMDELSVGYNGKPLIEHINIGVKKGEIVTLIGADGSALMSRMSTGCRTEKCPRKWRLSLQNGCARS